MLKGPLPFPSILAASRDDPYIGCTIDGRYKVEDVIGKPLSPYAITKYVDELFAKNFSDIYGIETIGLRYFNVFGPRQAFDSPYSGVIAKYCTAMLKGERPLVFGDGLQARDFTFVDNAVSANLLAAEAPAEKVAGKFFNSAAGDSISLLQLIDELNRLTNQKLEPEFQPPPRRRCPQFSRRHHRRPGSHGLPSPGELERRRRAHAGVLPLRRGSSGLLAA